MQNNNSNRRDDLTPYKIGGKLTILELMTLLAILGILVTVLLQKFF